MTFLTLTLPKHCHVLLLEDSGMRIAWFEKRIGKGYLKVVKTVAEMKEYIDSKPLIDYLFLDHDLGQGENGLDAAKFLVERFGATNNWGLIHSWNAGGAKNMQAAGIKFPHVPFGEFEIEVEK